MTLNYNTVALLFTDVRHSAGDAQLYLLLRMFTKAEHRKVLDVLRYDFLVKSVSERTEAGIEAVNQLNKTIAVIERSLVSNNAYIVPPVHADIINVEKSVPNTVRSILAQHMKMLPKEEEIE